MLFHILCLKLIIYFYLRLYIYLVLLTKFDVSKKFNSKVVIKVSFHLNTKQRGMEGKRAPFQTKCRGIFEILFFKSYRRYPLRGGHFHEHRHIIDMIHVTPTICLMHLSFLIFLFLIYIIYFFELFKIDQYGLEIININAMGKRELYPLSKIRCIYSLDTNEMLK